MYPFATGLTAKDEFKIEAETITRMKDKLL